MLSKLTDVNVNVAISQKRCKIETFLLQIGSDICMASWVAEIPMTVSRIKVIRLLQAVSISNVICFVQLCSSWQDFNWQRASRGRSAIAELPVIILYTYCILRSLNFKTSNKHRHKFANGVPTSHIFRQRSATMPSLPWVPESIQCSGMVTASAPIQPRSQTTNGTAEGQKHVLCIGLSSVMCPKSGHTRNHGFSNGKW